MYLKSFSTKELEEELAKRNAKPVLVKPTPLPNIDWSGVISTVEYIVGEIESGRWHEDTDDDHYVTEEVFKAVYGKNYYDWKNLKTQI